MPLCLAVSVSALPSSGECRSRSDWPQFRGPNASGVSDNQDLPDTWNVETGANIRWKTEIPGLGHASPIVTGNCIYVVTAESDGGNASLRVGLYGDIASVSDDASHAWRLYCLSKTTGKICWVRTLHDGVPTIKRHTKASHANSTPATDGFHVIVLLGSEGLFCYDRCGNRLWKKDFGELDSGYYVVPAAQWGFGSSPIIFKNMVIVQCDVQRDSFLTALDIRTGRELWRTPRADVPTWSTPAIFESAGCATLVVNGYKHAGGYDPWTGKELWKIGGGGDIPVPTPVVAHDLVYISSAHGSQRPLRAIRGGASGDITPASGTQLGEHIAWNLPRGGIYMQTPIVYGDYLYACADNGLLTCYEARTGRQLYRQRLGSGRTGFTASAVASDGKLFFTSEVGDIYVVRAGASFELLATNAMNEVCMATPAIAGGSLLVRAEKHLYAIGKPIASERRASRSVTRTKRAASHRRSVRCWRCR
jgi:outer membrane protein assembly factor BamB